MPQLELALWAGFAIGLVFGACGQITGFCLVRGLKEFWSGNAGYKLHAFALALAIALAGTHLIRTSGLVEIDRSMYLMPTFSVLLVPLGGLMFGYGMHLANGCGARALVLLASGNLRSFVVLICLGISAFITNSGLLAPLRVYLAELTAVTPSYISVPDGLPRSIAVLAIVALLLAFAFQRRDSGSRIRDLTGGAVVGVLIVAGWLATGWLGADDFDPMPVTSLTFIAPIGDTIQYAMISTGMTVRFGIAVVAGVFLGSLFAAIPAQRAKLRGFESASQMARYMAGGALMGCGGALALGCTIGQGLTGLSTLSFSSLLAAIAIVAGARAGWRLDTAASGLPAGT